MSARSRRLDRLAWVWPPVDGDMEQGNERHLPTRLFRIVGEPMTVHGDVEDKVIIVTGSNTGIGRVTAEELAGAGAHVFMACRSRQRSEPARDAIRELTGNDRVELLDLDLGSFDSVRACAEQFGARGLQLDVLINNAGLAGAKGMTESGFEVHFGVNHLGPFLLTHLLLGHMGAGGRIVNVASRAHTRVDGIDFDAVRETTRTRTGFPEYCVSKLANVVFNMKLAEVLEGTGISTYALHPGVVASDVWRRLPRFVQPFLKLFMITNREGAQTTLYCATSPRVEDQSGAYYDESALSEPAPHATDELADECWSRSLEWTGIEAGRYARA